MYNSQKTSDIIKRILLDKKITAKKMCEDCAIGVNTLSNIRRGDVKNIETFQIIADYLAVSVDYLLGRTGIPEDKIENHLHSSYNELTVANKEKVDDYIKKLLLEQQNEEPQEITITYAAKGQGSKTIQKAVSPETIDIIKRIMSEE